MCVPLLQDTAEHTLEESNSDHSWKPARYMYPIVVDTSTVLCVLEAGDQPMRTVL